MKKSRQLGALLMAAAITTASLQGCAKSGGNGSADTQGTSAQADQTKESASDNAPAEPAEAEADDKDRKSVV